MEIIYVHWIMIIIKTYKHKITKYIIIYLMAGSRIYRFSRSRGKLLRSGIGYHGSRGKYSKYRVGYNKKKKPMYKKQGQASSKLPFPLTRYVKLHVYDDTSITSTTGAINGCDAMCINSLYDPFQVGATNQPRWFDQLATIYLNYAVYACKVTAIVSNNDKTGEVGITMYDASAPATMREIDERENGYTRVMDTTAGAHTIIKLTKFLDIAKFVGMRRETYMNSASYRTDTGSDPANKLYAKIFYQAYGAQTGSVNVKLHMTFYARMTDIADPAES